MQSYQHTYCPPCWDRNLSKRTQSAGAHTQAPALRRKHSGFRLPICEKKWEGCYFPRSLMQITQIFKAWHFMASSIRSTRFSRISASPPQSSRRNRLSSRRSLFAMTYAFALRRATSLHFPHRSLVSLAGRRVLAKFYCALTSLLFAELNVGKQLRHLLRRPFAGSPVPPLAGPKAGYAVRSQIGSNRSHQFGASRGMPNSRSTRALASRSGSRTSGGRPNNS